MAIKDGDAPVILVSMALVLVGAVTLVIGFFNDQRPEFIYATIVTSLLAGVFLVFELLRQRPSQRHVLATGGEGQGTGGWGGENAWGAGLNGAATLGHDDAEYGGLEAFYDDEPVAVETPARYDSVSESSVVSELHGESATWWAADAARSDELTHTTRLADLESEWTSRRASWREYEPEPDPLERPQPVAQPVGAQPADVGAADADTDREKERFLAALAPVRGVGPSKQAELLAHFKTLRRLRNASVDRLTEIPGISTTLAQRIYDELHS